MALVGTEFARNHMEGKGWSSGEGLGKHGQGIVDALKPKLKFDQTGVGHNRAEEFEFHWWDHVFNKAAKSVKVEDSEGEVRVDFNSDKSELSTKKMRRKARKEIRNKLYSNFVKSGTLTGGKMEVEEKDEDGVVEVKDLSKLKELTDDELVAACGGRTAHKGSRHGLKMTAKLDRIAEAEREYMEKYNKKMQETEGEKQRRNQLPGNNTLQLEENSSSQEKKKKKKKKRSVEVEIENSTKKKKKLENEVSEDETLSLKSKKKKKRSKELESLPTDSLKKKKKHRKEKDAS